MTWNEVLETLPVIAILRGVRPDEAVAIAEALHGAGLVALEVPLNSPQPLESIRLIRDAFGERMLVGAGTVLTPSDVEAVADAGAAFVVSPNADPVVIAATKAAGMRSAPGVFTATEAFSALAAGADALKMFPADVAGPAGLKALKAVLPSSAPVLAVGGVEAENLAVWRGAGAAGVGVGSALYRPGATPADVRERALRFAAAWWPL
jgi:2-dehydro-3-deoxyphosphogalactonate aldolase